MSVTGYLRSYVENLGSHAENLKNRHSHAIKNTLAQFD